MKKFEKLEGPREVDFYTIKEDNKGNKDIFLIGFTYYGDNWIYAYVSGCAMPLEEFVNNMNEDEGYATCVYSDYTLYEDDLDEDEVLDLINTFFKKEPAYVLNFNEVTNDTPCGNYINFAD